MSTQRKIKASMLVKELVFSASRSDGPGGQNVNKVNSKVTVKFNVKNSVVLTDEEKDVVLKKLASKLTKDGTLIVTTQESRSQLENKVVAISKLEKIFEKAFEKKKIRKATKPTKGAMQDRINKKKLTAEKKKWRQKPE